MMTVAHNDPVIQALVAYFVGLSVLSVGTWWFAQARPGHSEGAQREASGTKTTTTTAARPSYSSIFFLVGIFAHIPALMMTMLLAPWMSLQTTVSLVVTMVLSLCTLLAYNFSRGSFEHDEAASSAAAATAAGSTKGTSLFKSPFWIYRLFLNKKFEIHRLLGLVYLFQYVYVWYAYLRLDYDTHVRPSVFLFTLPLNGVLQAISATYYFWFLPVKDDPGYYSDKSALSFKFVAENIFFSSLLAWQWIYFSDAFHTALQTSATLKAVEAFFVFFPYIVRPLFPKTRFRDSLDNKKNKTAGNQMFFHIGTQITKVFYLWAKWYIGFFLNYLRFMDKIQRQHQQELTRMLMFSCFATTISLFLHTLKFKGYIGPKLSFSLYVVSYMLTFYSMVKCYDMFVLNTPLVLITLVALLLNRFSSSESLQIAFQVLTMVALVGWKHTDGGSDATLLGHHLPPYLVILALLPAIHLAVSARKLQGELQPIQRGAGEDRQQHEAPTVVDDKMSKADAAADVDFVAED